MCIVCNAPDATYNYNNTYTNTITNTYTYTITYSNIQVRRILGKNLKKPIVIHRLWKKMCTPLWIGCAQTVY